MILDWNNAVGGHHRPSQIDFYGIRLLVLDPEVDAERFAAAYANETPGSVNWGRREKADRERVIHDVRHALRSLTKPPKPEEPTGLGAVVEDEDGTAWHRTRAGRWITEEDDVLASGDWSHVRAVKVLSEGVPS